MEEIKERFETFVDRDEYKGHVHRDTTAEEMLIFIQSEINLAVSKERGRIVEGVEKISSYYRHPMALFPKEGTTQEELKEMTIKEEIINLINTK